MVNAELNGDVHFFRFPSEIPSLGKFGPKIQNCQIKLKPGTKINSNMQNWMVLFTLYVLNVFGQILIQKNKIVSLSWNLVTRLIWICRIQWWCLIFLISTANKLFYLNYLTLWINSLLIKHKLRSFDWTFYVTLNW